MWTLSSVGRDHLPVHDLGPVSNRLDSADSVWGLHRLYIV